MSIASIAAAIEANLGGSFTPPYTKSNIQTRVATALYNSLQVGIAGNTPAGAGEIGETLTINRLRSNQLSTVSAGNVVNVCTTTSITLTPGDWQISGAVGFFMPTTTVTFLDACISKTSAARPSLDTIGVPSANGEFMSQAAQASEVAPSDESVTIPSYAVSVAVGTTLPLFLVAAATYTGTAVSVYGWMQARRMR